MKKELFALSLGFAALIWATQNASAQAAQTCGDRHTVIERLQSRFGESRQSIGLIQNNSVMEVFASNDTGTWTIVVTLPSGLTCLIAAGQAFEAMLARPVAIGDPV